MDLIPGKLYRVRKNFYMFLEHGHIATHIEKNNILLCLNYGIRKTNWGFSPPEHNDTLDLKFLLGKDVYIKKTSVFLFKIHDYFEEIT